jgi:hypothetical protein
MITGVRFSEANCHPGKVAARSVILDDGSQTFLCGPCLQKRNDAKLVARLESEPASQAAVAALHAALRAGNDRKAGSARRNLRDWTTPEGVRSVMRHLQRALIESAEDPR